MFRTLFTTLRAKILAGYIVVIIIMICVMIWSLYNFNRLNESYTKIITQNYSSIVAADNMVRALDSQINSLFLIFSKENPVMGESQFENSKKDFFYWLQFARVAAYTQSEDSILDSINSKYNLFLNKVNFLVTIPFNYPSNVKHEDEYATSIKLISRIKTKCYELFETNHNFIKQAETSVQSITQSAALSMLLLAIIGTVLSLIFSTKFSEFIVKPVKALTRSVKHISAGNFDEKISAEDTDEIGILADEFNSMVRRLKRYEKLNINKILYEKRKSEIIIESINDPVLIVDADLRILLSNKAFNSEFGKIVPEKTLLGEIIKDEPVLQNIKLFLSGKISPSQESVYGLLDNNGNTKYYKLRHSTINLPEIDINTALVVFSDITKYKELDILKSEFVAKVSHELKTPLTSMGMAIGILNDGIAGQLNNKQKELMNTMRDDYTRLNRMVKDTLELSRIESGGSKPNFEKVEIDMILKECIKTYALQSMEKDIKLIYHPANEKVYITADRQFLLTAIGNFLGNSIKFTPEGGEIIISLDKNSSGIVITISDNGTGINPEYLDKIFDKFVQVSGSSPGSVGLGLSIAKEIIDLHNGCINVWSKPGQGSKFEITLPV